MQFNVKKIQGGDNHIEYKIGFIREGEGNYVEAVTTDESPVIIINSGRGAQAKTQKIKLAGFVETMGWRAVGAKLFDYNKSVNMEWDIKKSKNKPAGIVLNPILGTYTRLLCRAAWITIELLIN